LFAAGNVGTQLDAFHRMLVTPPIDAFVSGEDVERATANRDAARPENQEPRRSPELLLRYMHDCTRPDDRVLVSGSTPFDVNYLIGRPLAGGHLFWHHRWRADAVREAALLALIQSQSIPFAYSTTDPILDDLEEYPRIRQYFADHYRSLPGTSDRLLVDTRREARSSFGPFGFPCFE
jgi:hypothetical protein